MSSIIENSPKNFKRSSVLKKEGILCLICIVIDLLKGIQSADEKCINGSNFGYPSSVPYKMRTQLVKEENSKIYIFQTTLSLQARKEE